MWHPALVAHAQQKFGYKSKGVPQRRRASFPARVAEERRGPRGSLCEATSAQQPPQQALCQVPVSVTLDGRVVLVFCGRAAAGFRGRIIAEGAQGVLRSRRLEKGARGNFISGEVVMRLWGNGTDDSCSTSCPGRSKRSLRRRRSIISCLTPQKLPAATASHLSQHVCSGTWRYGPGAEAGGRDGRRGAVWWRFKGQAHSQGKNWKP